VLLEKLFLGHHPKDGRQLELAGQQVGGQPSYGPRDSCQQQAGGQSFWSSFLFWVDLPLKGRPLNKVDC
jgi:hypothetical protein